MTTISEVIRAGFPNAGEDLCDHILWGRTPYPAGKINAQSLYKAASGFYRAFRNNIDLCDFCDRPATNRWLCARCNEALRGGDERNDA